MKIELKNTDFKTLFEYLDGRRFDTEEMYNIVDSLREQYKKDMKKKKSKLCRKSHSQKRPKSIKITVADMIQGNNKFHWDN